LHIGQQAIKKNMPSVNMEKIKNELIITPDYIETIARLTTIAIPFSGAY
jgi:hypothetical protein